MLHVLLMLFGMHLHSGSGRLLASSPSAASDYNLYTYEKPVDVSRITRKGGGTDDENYGMGLSSCGERVFIGSYTDQYHYIKTGAVYIYTLSSSGQEWNLESKLHPMFTSSDTYFGWSLACSTSSSVAVGAYGDNSLGMDKAGAVFMFDYIPTGTDSLGSLVGSWQEQGVLYSDNPQEHEYFGWAVAVDVDLLVVSAIGNSELFTECGVVYVYKYSVTAATTASSTNSMYAGSSPQYATRSNAGQDTDNDNNDDNNNNDDNDNNNDYVDNKAASAPPGWVLEAVIAPSDPYAYMNFGWSLGAYGDVVVVGAPWMFSRRGVVYVYNRGLTENSAYDDLYYMDEGEYTYSLENTIYSATLTQDTDLLEMDTKSYFGYSLAIDQDLLVIGHYLGHAYHSTSGSGSGSRQTEGEIDYTSLMRSGRAYVCRVTRSSTSTDTGTDTDTVTMVADLGELAASALGEYSFFGYDVSISGHTIVVGAPGDGHANRNTSVFVFTAEDANREFWKLSQHWHGDDFAPSAPDRTAEQLHPSRFGIVTATSQEGGVVFVTDSHGMSSDYIQTGCVFAWSGVFYVPSDHTHLLMNVFYAPLFWVVLALSVVMVTSGCVVMSKKRQRSDVDNILGDDQNISMTIGSGKEEECGESNWLLVRLINRVSFVLQRRLSSAKDGMQMVSLPTDSTHGEGEGEREEDYNFANNNQQRGSHSTSGSMTATLDTRKLIATAQAVADDDNHPNHEEVAELIRSYKREGISSERFQKEFQRLIF